MNRELPKDTIYGFDITKSDDTVSSAFYKECNVVGGMAQHTWDNDPKRLGIVLARYKHVAKMLAGMHHVLEVGCSDGFGSRVVRQHVQNLDAVDIDPAAIEIAKKNRSQKWPIEFYVYDVMNLGPPRYPEQFDAVYCLDVLEHIAPNKEDAFLRRLIDFAPVAVIGTPSLESQAYASELSKRGHVNCKTAVDLQVTLKKHWRHVFLFCMNDETLHTGFYPMANYLLALAVA